MNMQEARKLEKGQILYSTVRRGSDRRPHRVKVSSVHENQRYDLITINVKFGLWQWYRIHEEHLHEWETTEQIAIARLCHEFVS